MGGLTRFGALLVGGLVGTVPSMARAEGSPATTVTLDQAVSAALADHPRIREAHALELAAAARVDEARTGYLPDVGVSAQLNRSTGNTAPGAFFPTPGFVPIAGAPQGRAFDGGTFQTGVSLWATWDVTSVLRQSAAVDLALAGSSGATAATEAARLELAYTGADAFLLLAEAEEAVKASAASVERAKVFLAVVQPLVDQNLHAGVDAVRATAELGIAQTQLARAEQIREIRRAKLAEAMGIETRVEIALGALLAAGEEGPSAAPTLGNHPLVRQGDAAVSQTTEAQRAVRLEYLPRVELVAALWLRGSGSYGSPADGLAPDVPNWATGLTVTWAFLDIPTISARARVASASHAAAVARRDETYLMVSSDLRTATAFMEGALRVAKNTPSALASARAAEQQATARYKAGLTSVLEVADAQRLLAQAEVDDATARIEVRRAALLLARAAGDLTPFLTSARGG